jgi:nitrate reductase alpha subunit
MAASSRGFWRIEMSHFLDRVNYFSSPTWSGIESETVSYNAGYTNVHELIPWRTFSGRQQFYQDHPWIRAFGETLASYRPPVDLKATAAIHGLRPNGLGTYNRPWIGFIYYRCLWNIASNALAQWQRPASCP